MNPNNPLDVIAAEIESGLNRLGKIFMPAQPVPVARGGRGRSPAFLKLEQARQSAIQAPEPASQTVEVPNDGQWHMMPNGMLSIRLASLIPETDHELRHGRSSAPKLAHAKKHKKLHKHKHRRDHGL